MAIMAMIGVRCSYRFCVDDDANNIRIFHSAGDVRGSFSLVIPDVDIYRSFNQDLRDFALSQRSRDVKSRVTVLILRGEKNQMVDLNATISLV